MKNSEIFSTCKLLILTSSIIAMPVFAQQYANNLLVNGDAETLSSSNAVPGWMIQGNVSIQKYGSKSGFPTATDSGLSNPGKNFFYGGNEGEAVAKQVVDLTFAANDIDHGHVQMDFSAWLSGEGKQNDSASIILRFLDANQNELEVVEQLSSAEQSSGKGFEQRQLSWILPESTRAIMVELHFNHVQGASQSYIDDVTLILNNNSESGACAAVYEVDGRVHLPCVDVLDAKGDRQSYDVYLQLVPNSTPYRFVLKSIAQGVLDPDGCEGLFESSGNLQLPCVSVPVNESERAIFPAQLQLVPSSNPFTFELLP